jgi:glycogen(starch) synthase
VIKTKTPVTVAEYKDRYCLVGPLNHKTAPLEVDIIEEPENKAVAAALGSLRQAGIHYMYGKWLVDGSPLVLLLDVGSAYGRLNEWKADLWQHCGIPSPSEDRETNEAILFGYLNAWFLGELVHHLQIQADQQGSRPPAVIAHFHEWLAGVGLVLIKKRALNVATIFTTHATLLGRYLCAGDVDFYNNLKYFDVDAESGKRGIYHRYCIERAAAHSADVFTTVSHITAYESEYLLKRRPGICLDKQRN